MHFERERNTVLFTLMKQFIDWTLKINVIQSLYDALAYDVLLTFISRKYNEILTGLPSCSTSRSTTRPDLWVQNYGSLIPVKHTIAGVKNNKK